NAASLYARCPRRFRAESCLLEQALRICHKFGTATQRNGLVRTAVGIHHLDTERVASVLRKIHVSAASGDARLPNCPIGSIERRKPDAIRIGGDLYLRGCGTQSGETDIEVRTS